MCDVNQLYQFSVPADSALAPECFTTLTVRIHKNSEIADQAAANLLKVLGKSQPDAVLTTNKTGNFSALACAECLPKRLGMATFLNDLGLLHDDAVDGMDINKTNDAHTELIAVFRLAAKGGDIDMAQVANPKHMQLLGFLKKFIATDPEAALQVCVEYENYLKAVDSSDKEFVTMAEWVPYRIPNCGYWILMAIIRFAMDIRLTAEELESIHALELLIGEVAGLTNDFWSWEKEVRAQSVAGYSGLPHRNAVAVLMKEKHVGAVEAKELLKQHILAVEAEFLQKVSDWQSTPGISYSLRRYVMSMEIMAGGNSYWSSTCDRYA
ncbi:isoprenoid synthase domain-containing protein [Trichoderma barbatum]